MLSKKISKIFLFLIILNLIVLPISAIDNNGNIKTEIAAKNIKISSFARITQIGAVLNKEEKNDLLIGGPIEGAKKEAVREPRDEPERPNCRLLGDLNNNRQIDCEDVALIFERYYSNQADYAPCEDVNNDRSITPQDAQTLINTYNLECYKKPSQNFYNVTLTIATLKDEYHVGEQINLTDPPENNQITGNAVTDYISPEAVINNEYTLPAENQVPSEEPKYHGYIIKLSEVPLLKIKSDIDKQIKEKEVFVEKTTNVDLRTKALEDINTLKNSLQKEINRQNRKVVNEKINFKQKASQILDKKPLKVMGEFSKSLNGLVLDISKSEAEKLKNQIPEIETYPNFEVSIDLIDSIPQIGANEVWTRPDLGYTGENITIAILDTGIDYTHPDLGECIKSEFLAGNCEKVIGGYDFVECDHFDGDCVKPRAPDLNPMDDHGHGTHVASIAAGKGDYNNNGVYDPKEVWGVAPDAKLYAYKALNRQGTGLSSWIINGMESALDPNNDTDFSDHVDVISMSFGAKCHLYGYPPDCGPGDLFGQQITTLVNEGIIVVTAAGNSHSENTIGSPGTSLDAITVGATDRFDDIAGFSSRSPVVWTDHNGRKRNLIKPDVVAPGVDICAARSKFRGLYYLCVDMNHISNSGTSMATPMVSGAAALLRQAHPDWSVKDIKMVLRGTADDIGEEVYTQGYGRINLPKAFKITHPLPSTEINDSLMITGQGAYSGTAKGDFFSYYEFSSKERNDNEWNLICSSSRPIENEIICPDFDIRNMPNGFHEFKLKVFDIFNNTNEDRTFFRIHIIDFSEPRSYDMLSGQINLRGYIKDKFDIYNLTLNNYMVEFKKVRDTYWSNEGIELINNGTETINRGVFAVWNTSNIREKGFYNLRLIVNYKESTHEKYIRYIYFDPDLRGGWPQKVGSIQSSPAIADLDGDGDLEIVVGSDDNKVYAWNYDGSLVDANNDGIPEWPVETGSMVRSSPAIADLDGDGDLEVAVGSHDYRFYVWNHDGSLFDANNDGTPEWPQAVYYKVESSPAIADLDGDSELEIFIGSEYGRVFVWNHNGSLVEGWPENIIHHILSSPAIADLDGDGDLEIVVGSSDGGYDSFDGNVYVWHSNGTLMDRWPKEMKRYILSSPAIADLDGDGDLEIVVGSYFYDDKVYAWNYDGSLVDANNDGTPEWPRRIMGDVATSPAIGDLDRDGILEIVVTTKGGYIHVLKNIIFTDDELPWPTFQHDLQRTGLYTKPRPQSRLDNHGGKEVSGILTIKIQTPGRSLQKVGGDERWEDYLVVYSEKEKVIPEKVIKLDSRFNPTNTKINEPGTYRVYAEFDYGTGNVNSDWKFNVNERGLNCNDSDGGKKYYIRGHLIGEMEQPGDTIYHLDNDDICTNVDRLSEFFCYTKDGTFYGMWETYVCPHGCNYGLGACICIQDDECPESYNCQNGACLDENVRRPGEVENKKETSKYSEKGLFLIRIIKYIFKR